METKRSVQTKWGTLSPSLWIEFARGVNQHDHASVARVCRSAAQAVQHWRAWPVLDFLRIDQRARDERLVQVITGGLKPVKLIWGPFQRIGDAGIDALRQYVTTLTTVSCGELTTADFKWLCRQDKLRRLEVIFWAATSTPRFAVESLRVISAEGKCCLRSISESSEMVESLRHLGIRHDPDPEDFKAVGKLKHLSSLAVIARRTITRQMLEDLFRQLPGICTLQLEQQWSSDAPYDTGLFACTQQLPALRALTVNIVGYFPNVRNALDVPLRLERLRVMGSHPLYKLTVHLLAAMPRIRCLEFPDSGMTLDEVQALIRIKKPIVVGVGAVTDDGQHRLVFDGNGNEHVRVCMSDVVTRPVYLGGFGWAPWE